MKKASWIHWAVAIILVGLAGYSAVYIHRAEEKNALKVERQAKLDKQEEKRKKELLREQKKHMQTPIDWQKPSETLPYPEVSQAIKAKKLDQKIWLLVSPNKQRVYVRQGPYTLYTMYASIGKNFENVIRLAQDLNLSGSSKRNAVKNSTMRQRAMGLNTGHHLEDMVPIALSQYRLIKMGKLSKVKLNC